MSSGSRLALTGWLPLPWIDPGWPCLRVLLTLRPHFGMSDSGIDHILLHYISSLSFEWWFLVSWRLCLLTLLEPYRLPQTAAVGLDDVAPFRSNFLFPMGQEAVFLCPKMVAALGALVVMVGAMSQSGNSTMQVDRPSGEMTDSAAYIPEGGPPSEDHTDSLDEMWIRAEEDYGLVRPEPGETMIAVHRQTSQRLAHAPDTWDEIPDPSAANWGKVRGISCLAPPYPCNMTGLVYPGINRWAWNMRSPGKTQQIALPARCNIDGRDPCSKHALAQVRIGGLLKSKSSSKFLEWPWRGHSPVGGKKISWEVHSPMSAHATVQSQVCWATQPAKGVRASPVWTQAAHSAESISSRGLRVARKSCT